MTISDLARQRHEMQTNGIDIHAIEVGPETWKMILNQVGVGKPEEVTEGWLFGMHVRPANVPEGKLWPLEGVR